jgi:hypothetical protein
MEDQQKSHSKRSGSFKVVALKDLCAPQEMDTELFFGLADLFIA